MKRLTAKAHGVSPHFFDHGFDTRSNVYKVDGTIMSERWTCVMTKQLTFAQEPKGNELFVAQVDDLCGKRSVLHW
jgi:hypothetical protein